PRPPPSTLFPYTTLFRSSLRTRAAGLPGVPVPGEVTDPIGNPLTIQLRNVCERSVLHCPATSGGMSGVGGAVWVKIVSAFLLTPDRKSTRLNSSHVSISY